MIIGRLRVRCSVLSVAVVQVKAKFLRPSSPAHLIPGQKSGESLDVFESYTQNLTGILLICFWNVDQIFGQIFDQIFDQIFGQVFDQGFDQGFDQVLGEGKNNKYSVQYYPDKGKHFKNTKNF